MKRLNGLIASEGLATGKLHCIMAEPETTIPSYKISDKEIPIHKERFAKAIEDAKEDLAELLSDSIEENKNETTNKPEENILNTHIMMLNDSFFLNSVYKEIENKKVNVEFALKTKLQETIEIIKQSNDPYLSERAVDIEDAFDSVFNHLLHSRNLDNSRFSQVPKGSIIVAKLIKPSEALLVKNAGVSGIIMEEGGVTSHIAIMARAWNIPMLVGVEDCLDFALFAVNGILDADEGCVLLNPTEKDIIEYNEKIKQREIEIKELLAHQEVYAKRLSMNTNDGVRVSVNSNIAIPEEIENKFVTISNGIGLFRSEFLFLEDGKLPNEEQQFLAYKKVVKAMGEKYVAIRTFDIGADKMIDEQKQLREVNPLLGWRAIRYCLDRKEIFKTQIRAILRASYFGNAFIVIPMISTVNEIIEVKKIIEECKKECDAKGQKYDKEINIGIVVEVPSTAIAADLYAPYIDFFTIGTNDLIQYTMAADRENTKVSYLADYFEPAVLRLIKSVLDAQKFIKDQEGYLVSMCGEMASHEDAVFLLLGMGLRHFSMPASKILKMQKFMEKINVSDAEKLYDEVKSMDSAKLIKEKVQKAISKYID